MNTIHRLILDSASVLTLLLVACGSGDEGSGQAGGAVPSRPGNLGEVLQVRGDTVEVKMDEYIFGFAVDTIPAGRVVFHIQNLGFEHHNLDFHLGDSVVYEMDEDIDPAQYRFLELTLEPGEYEVICTIAGHDGKGMVETLVVVARDHGG
ncbi:MAG: hypothetical protein WEG36_03560 [Gemmatimonadota bacterium]